MCMMVCLCNQWESLSEFCVFFFMLSIGILVYDQDFWFPGGKNEILIVIFPEFDCL